MTLTRKQLIASAAGAALAIVGARGAPAAADLLPPEAERLAGRLTSDLNYATIGDIFDTGLHQYLDRIQMRLGEIAEAMHGTYCDWMEAEPAQEQVQQ